MAYLVRQSQKEVIEEDGGGRDCVILIATARSRSQTRLKSMPTFLAVLGYHSAKVRSAQLRTRSVEGASQIIANVDDLVQSSRRHDRWGEKDRALFVKQPGTESYLKRGPCISSACAKRVDV